MTVMITSRTGSKTFINDHDCSCNNNKSNSNSRSSKHYDSSSNNDISINSINSITTTATTATTAATATIATTATTAATTYLVEDTGRQLARSSAASLNSEWLVYSSWLLCFLLLLHTVAVAGCCMLLHAVAAIDVAIIGIAVVVDVFVTAFIFVAVNIVTSAVAASITCR